MIFVTASSRLTRVRSAAIPKRLEVLCDDSVELSAVCEIVLQTGHKVPHSVIEGFGIVEVVVRSADVAARIQNEPMGLNLAEVCYRSESRCIGIVARTRPPRV